jgi:hypothetical protein
VVAAVADVAAPISAVAAGSNSPLRNEWGASSEAPRLLPKAEPWKLKDYGFGGGAVSTLPIPRSPFETSNDIRYWTATYF